MGKLALLIFSICFTAKKASAFILQCHATLFNTVGNVTGHHGKHFLVSRQTLYFMAFRPQAQLLSLPGFNSLACGGIVIVPKNNEAAKRGKKYTLLQIVLFDFNDPRFFTVECKKPWNFLALTIYKGGNPSVVFPMPGSKSLKFIENNYITRFGPGTGQSLFTDISEELKLCSNVSISTENIRMKICIVIWKHFGVAWTKIFSLIQESRQTTPEQGFPDFCDIFYSCFDIP